jgi:outer membrane autotransporter protein
MAALRLDGSAGGGASADGAGAYGVWADAYGAFGERDENGGYAGYDVDGWGVTAGFDATVSSQWLLGLSVGYGESDLTFDAYEGESEQSFTYVSAYTSWTGERAYVDGTLLYGTGEQDDERPVEIVGLPRFATSEHDITSTAFSLEGVYDLSSGGVWAWGPFAALRGVRIDEDDFVEAGAGDVSLLVDGEEADALMGDLGIGVWRATSGQAGQLVPALRVAWVHDFDVDDTDVNAAFIGAPDIGFTMPGQAAEEDGLRLSLGLGYDSERRVSTLLRYVGEFRGDVEWHGIQGLLRWEF